MRHEYRRPCSRLSYVPAIWKDLGLQAGYKPATAELQARDRLATAGLHHQGSKTAYMDQCTFGAGPLHGARMRVRKLT